MAGGIGLSHDHAAVLHGSFQSIFRARGIGSQCSGQLVVQSIAGVVVDATLSLVSIGSGQADGGQHGVGALRVIEAIQYAHLTLTIHDLVAHGNVSDAKVGELHTLDGVFAQLIHDGVIMQTGGNVGLRVPHAVRAGLGDIVLINRKRRLLAGVNGSLGKCRSHQAEGHERRHQQRQYAMDLFHLVVSLFII